MPEEKPFNIQDYLAIGLRRKWYIIIPLIVGVLVSFGVYKYLPKIYKSTTLILVQPQRVPESYVRPTITDSVVSRLNTISQEILSRTRLEKVIQEFNLFSEVRKNVPMEGFVEMMRSAIEVNVQTNPKSDRGHNSFSISFMGKDPKTVMMVTNKLASLFIEENLKVRESQAEGTSDFLSKELVSMEERLKRKEQEIRNYKERTMGQLPQQLDANLRIMERLQQQLKTTNESLRATEDRSIVIQNQLELLKKRELTQMVQIGSQGDIDVARGEDPLITRLKNLKEELAIVQSKYKETHPDVVVLKKRIADLEPKVRDLIENMEQSRDGKVVERKLPPPTLDPETQRLFTQYTEQYNAIILEAKRLREEEKELKQQLNFYQRRIEDTPRREQELIILTRDYDLFKANYQSLLDKKIQSQMAENLERKQQGEQFKILDPARIPEKPIKPDRNRILLMGAMIGLVAGLGLAWFRESMDKTFRAVLDVESYLEIPVLATIPNLKEEEKKAA
jgi:polysaccharide chain length determinant protein (PEP-CTERM system associated)